MNNNCEISERPKTLKELVKSKIFWKPVLGFAIGGVVGLLYYIFVGCTSGTCAITSTPIGSIFMGGMLGLFVTTSPCSSCSR